MRRKNREITIFSMSALDLFASALGAFILVTLILLPYYLKEKPSKTPAEGCDVPQMPVCQSCPLPKEKQCPPQKPKVVKRVLADSFMMLTIEWNGYYDIDTYVETPDGWFGPQQMQIPGSGGALVIDKNWATSSSVELWKITGAKPGIYTFCASLYGAFYRAPGIKYPLPPLSAIRARAKLEKPTGVIQVNNIGFSQVITDQYPFPARKGDMTCYLKVELGADMKARRL